MKPQSINDFKNKLGLSTSPLERKEILEAIIDVYKNETLFKADGLCGNQEIKVFPNNYFLAQQFDSQKEDIRQALSTAFDNFGLSEITVDKQIGGELFCNIVRLIFGTPFGIYHLNEQQNRNVYFELGISIGLKKPFILIKDNDAKVADIISAIHYYQIENYLKTGDELGTLANKYIAELGWIDKTLVNEQLKNENEICISLGELEVVDIGFTIAKFVSHFGYQPIFLGKFNTQLSTYLKKININPIFISSLTDITNAIQRSKLGIYRVDKSSSPDTFVSLGIALGLNRPIFPIFNNRDTTPSDLSIFSILEFSGFTELEEKLPEYFKIWLNNNDLQNELE